MASFKVSHDWGDIFLSYQNEIISKSYCDLKLICSDGYIMVHKVLTPNFKPAKSSGEAVLDNLNLQNLSKLIFLIYTGEALMLKVEQQLLRKAFSMFKMTRMKRILQQNNKTTRRSSSGGVGPQNGNLNDTKEKIAKRKIRGVKYVEGQETEEIFIFGDGSTIAVPIEDQRDAQSPDTRLYYDVNGCLMRTTATGFPCPPCSMIFCDKIDYNDHESKCNNKIRITPTLTKIKVEHQVVKLEVEASSPDHSVTANYICFICNSCYAEINDFLLHYNERHDLAETDYDISLRKCQICNESQESFDLSKLLQHVYKCKELCTQSKSMTQAHDGITPRKSSESHHIQTARKNARNQIFEIMRLTSARSSDKINDLCDFDTALNKVNEFANFSSTNEDNMHNPKSSTESDKDEAAMEHTFLNPYRSTDLITDMEDLDTSPILKIKSLESLQGKVKSSQSEKAKLTMEPSNGESRISAETLGAKQPENGSIATNQAVKRITEKVGLSTPIVPKRHIKLSASASKTAAAVLEAKPFDKVQVKMGISEEKERETKKSSEGTHDGVQGSKYLNWKCYRCITFFSSQSTYMLHECK